MNSIKHLTIAFACSLNIQLILVNHSSIQVYFNFLLYIARIILKVPVYVFIELGEVFHTLPILQVFPPTKHVEVCNFLS